MFIQKEIQIKPILYIYLNILRYVENQIIKNIIRTEKISETAVLTIFNYPENQTYEYSIGWLNGTIVNEMFYGGNFKTESDARTEAMKLISNPNFNKAIPVIIKRQKAEEQLKKSNAVNWFNKLMQAILQSAKCETATVHQNIIGGENMTTDIIELKIKFAEKHKLNTGDKVPKNADPEEVRILRQAGYLIPNGDTDDLIFWRYQ